MTNRASGPAPTTKNIHLPQMLSSLARAALNTAVESESDDEMRDAGGQKRGLSEATNAEEEEPYQHNQDWQRGADSLQPNQLFAHRDHESAAENNEMICQDIPQQVWEVGNEHQRELEEDVESL